MNVPLPLAIDSNPNMPICYVCGRQFGHSSIKIHEPQCLEKWHHENSQLPRRQQRPEPLRPVGPDSMGTMSTRRSYDDLCQHNHNVPPFALHNPPHGNPHPQRDFYDMPPARYAGPQPLGHVRIGYINGNEYGMDTYQVYRPDGADFNGPALRHVEEDRFYGTPAHNRWEDGRAPRRSTEGRMEYDHHPGNMAINRVPYGRHDYRGSILPPASYSHERPPPSGHFGRPTEEQMDRMAYNDFQAHLIPCHNCGRRFRRDLVGSHSRRCAEHPEVFRRH